VYLEHDHHPEGPRHLFVLHLAAEAAAHQKAVRGRVDQAEVAQKENRELGRNLICEK